MSIGRRELIFFLLLMAIPVGAWLMVFNPQNQRNDRMLRQIEARQRKLRALDRATATIGDLKKEIGTLEKAIGYFNSKLPGEKEMDKVLHEIWMLAESSQVRATSISTNKVRSSAKFAGRGAAHGEQPIAVTLEGNFRGLYRFLLALENQPRITRVIEMNIKNVTGDVPDGEIKAEFVMSVFYEKASAGGAS